MCATGTESATTAVARALAPTLKVIGPHPPAPPAGRASVGRAVLVSAAAGRTASFVQGMVHAQLLGAPAAPTTAAQRATISEASATSALLDGDRTAATLAQRSVAKSVPAEERVAAASMALGSASVALGTPARFANLFAPAVRTIHAAVKGRV